VIFDCENT